MVQKYSLSVIVPLYNEERRAAEFLAQLCELANAHKDWEVIFVNDGSTDNTLGLLKSSGIKNSRILSYRPNRGKGYAVRKGVAHALGTYIIFIDADGSINPHQIIPMLAHLKKFDVVVGSRASPRSKVTQSVLRRATGIAFNTYVNVLFQIRINDNLCGFKGFKGSVGRKLFSALISNRWIFDVELFYKIRKSGRSLYQMPIAWVYKRQSKMSLTDPFKMAFELIILRCKLWYKS